MSETPELASLSQPSVTKTVLIYRNGDAFYPGKKFVVNRRHTATFDSFLSAVTRGIQAPFGAVRNIYTPEGQRIVDLEQFLHGERYVAAGAERLKKLDYYHITPKRPQGKKNTQIRPVVHSKIIVPARWRTNINEPCTINVFTNGDVMAPPARILLPKYTRTSWEQVLTMVTEKVHLRTGAVQRLCRLDGTPLSEGEELENNQYYVAVGAEKFRSLTYSQWLPSRGAILDFSYAIKNNIFPQLKRDWHPKNVYAYRPEDNAESHFYTQAERVKPQKNGSEISHLFGAPEGGVFRAKDKRKEMEGVSEVQDDSNIHVDLPIDLTEAKVVDEEQREQKKTESEICQNLPETFLKHSNVNSTPGTSDKTPENETEAEESEKNSLFTMISENTAKFGLEVSNMDTEGEETSSMQHGIRSRVSKFFKDSTIGIALSQGTGRESTEKDCVEDTTLTGTGNFSDKNEVLLKTR